MREATLELLKVREGKGGKGVGGGGESDGPQMKRTREKKIDDRSWWEIETKKEEDAPEGKAGRMKICRDLH